MNCLSYICTNEDQGKKLKWILKSKLQISESLIKTLKWKESAILVNKNSLHVDYVVQENDLVEVNIADTKPFSSNIAINHIPLDILYEDESLLIINKPAGISIHSNSSKTEIVTIAGMVAGYLGNTSFHAVNRLDRGVTGIMVIAKNGYMHTRLMKLLHTDGFQREYLGICEGIPCPSEGTIEKSIGRNSDSILIRKIDDNGLPSKTIYRVISSKEHLSLVHLIPVTGRTHQLRLHMASIGHPLIGDWLYGHEGSFGMSRPALHSYKLQLNHPLSNRKILLTCPLPEDMSNFFPNVGMAKNI